MFCIKCGKSLPEGAKFCPACGTAVAQPASPAQGHGVSVDQHVETNEGQVVGLSAGKGALQDGLSAKITQDVGMVKDGGAVVGAVLGGEGPVHVGGQQFYDEVVLGDKVGGDKSEATKSEATKSEATRSRSAMCPAREWRSDAGPRRV